MSRISSLDSGYTSGQLSLYPEAYDDGTQLYTAVNNQEQVLKHTLPYGGTQIIVDDASGFPQNGLVRVGPHGPEDAELIYFGSRTNSVLSNLIRGFAGSRQNVWPAFTSYVSCSVMAEHHNAAKDAILNIENFVGTSVNPSATSLNGILTALETNYLAPKPIFRAYPAYCVPGTPITFQNFSEGDVIRFLWDFGDGSQSTERNPVHTYSQEGMYTVQLTIITVTSAQGIVTKSNCINCSLKAASLFFYVSPQNNTPNYSITTATNLSLSPQVFLFMDQSDGNIIQRYWIFGDGTTLSVNDPNKHWTTYSYQNPGTYSPTLILVFSDNSTGRVFLNNQVVVI